FGFAFGLHPQIDLFAGGVFGQSASLFGVAEARFGVGQRRAESGRHGPDPVSGRLIDFDVAEWADRPGRRQIGLKRAAVMLLRSRVWKLLTRRTGRLRHPPAEHFVMLSQRRIVEIQHRHRAMVAGVEPRIDRAEAERALFDRNVGLPDLPGDERLAIAAVDPRAGIGEVVGEGVFVAALFAYDNSARARHGEGGMMLQAMNFDYICKHVSVEEWGMGTEGKVDKGTRGQGDRKFLILLSPPLLVSLSSFHIPRSDYILAAAASTARRT